MSKPALLEDRYRSRLEERIGGQLEKAGIPFHYEETKINYTVPARKARYTPDFPLGNKASPQIFIEAKGRFRTAAERQKMILVQEQNPTLDIRFVFQNAKLPLYKGSPTTHGMWAESHGFKWADNGEIPQEWLNEIGEKK